MKLKIVRNSFIILMCSIFLYFFIFCNIEKYDDSNRKINVLYNNQSIELKLGATYNELKEISNINNLNIDDEYVLHNNEIFNDNFNKIKKISINEASLKELETLPGIGEKIALRIIDYRKQYGKFKIISELKEVSGIGDKKYEKIEKLISI